MPVIALANSFFRSQFKQPSQADNFKSLKNLVTSTGGVAYSIFFGVGVIFCLIALMVGGFALAMSSKGRSYDEAKRRIMRVAIIMAFMMNLAGLVLMIADVFLM